MSFRRLGVLILGVLISTGLVAGCGYFLDEKPLSEQDKAIKIPATKESACLKNAGESISTYLNNNNRADVTDEWLDCLIRSFELFKKYTAGQRESQYTVLEIQSFIDTFFLEDESSPSNLIELSMKLKYSLIGGSSESVTDDEIDQLIELFKFSKGLLRDLSPYMSVYDKSENIDRKNEKQVKRVYEAIDVLVDAAEKLGKRFTRKDLPDMVVNDIFSILRYIDNSEFKNWINQYEHVLKAAKALFVSPPEDRIRAENWKTGLSAFSRVFGLFIKFDLLLKNDGLFKSYADLFSFWARFRHSLNNPDVYRPNSFRHITHYLDEMIFLLKSSIKTHPSSTIPEQEFVNILSAMDKAGLMKGGLVKTSSIIALVNPVIDKMFRPYYIQKGRGVSTDHLKYFETEYEIWKQSQQITNELFSDKEKYKHTELQREVATKILFHKTHQSERLKIYQDFQSLISEGRPLVWLPNKTNLIPNVSQYKKVNWTYRDLTVLTLTKTMVRVFLKGYSQDPTRSFQLGGLNETEVIQLYNDFRPIGLDLRVMDPRSYTAGSRSFMEINLFTSVSEDWSVVDYREGVEFIYHLLSSSYSAENVRVDAKACNRKNNDIFEIPLIEKDCFFRQLEAHIHKYLAHIPSWVRVLKDQPEKTKKFSRMLIESLRAKHNINKDLESSEVQVFTSIIQHAANLFERFNKNNDDKLDDEETWESFPYVEEFLRRMGKGQIDSEFKSKTLFSYLLAHGEPPSMARDGITHSGLASFAYWSLRRYTWTEQTDLMGLLKIMKGIGMMGRRDAYYNFYKYIDENLEKIYSDIHFDQSIYVHPFLENLRCSPVVSHRLTHFLKERHELMTPNSELSKEDQIKTLLQDFENEPDIQWNCDLPVIPCSDVRLIKHVQEYSPGKMGKTASGQRYWIEMPRSRQVRYEPQYVCDESL